MRGKHNQNPCSSIKPPATHLRNLHQNLSETSLLLSANRLRPDHESFAKRAWRSPASQHHMPTWRSRCNSRATDTSQTQHFSLTAFDSPKSRMHNSRRISHAALGTPSDNNSAEHSRRSQASALGRLCQTFLAVRTETAHLSHRPVRGARPDRWPRSMVTESRIRTH